LLWEVLQSVGYLQAPRYVWERAELGEMHWANVTLEVPPHPIKPQWIGWRAEGHGQSPWEGAQVAALDVLMSIAQNLGNELVNGPASSIPQVEPTIHAMAPRRNTTVQAMLAVLKAGRERQGTVTGLAAQVVRVMNEARTLRQRARRFK
jgi:hypothetical protein